MKNKYFVFIVLLLLSGGALTLSSCKKHASQTHNEQKYHCPMHPTYVSDKMGDCPICGMKLVPIEADSTATEDASEEMHVSDRADVDVPTDAQERIGLQTSEVKRETLTSFIHASARVAYDPDLYNTLMEYRQVLRMRQKADVSDQENQDRTSELEKALILRLRQMGLNDSDLASLVSSDTIPTNLLLPQGGEKVWVYAHIYESESSLVKPGQTMEITSSALPGKRMLGTVRSVDSILDPATRTLRVRAEFSNPGNVLKPQMYLNAVIRMKLGVALAIPLDAVVKTGTRDIVFVETSPNSFEPRDIVSGRVAGDHIEIVSGLEEGERVVTSANFFLDSESKLKAALKGTSAAHSH